MGNNSTSNTSAPPSCGEIIAAILILIGVFVAVRVIAVQIATYDDEAPPSCQHFPASMRCVEMDFDTCLQECRPPRLATYISRKRTAEVVEYGIFYLLEKLVDWASDDDTTEKEAEFKEWTDRLYYGTSIVLALATSERTHFSNCAAACLYRRETTRNGTEL